MQVSNCLALLCLIGKCDIYGSVYYAMHAYFDAIKHLIYKCTYKPQTLHWY